MDRKLSKFEQTDLPDGTIVYWGTEPMNIPVGGPHVRQCSIYLPQMAKANAILATVYSTDSSGQVFAIWSIKKVYEKDYTQFAISATNTTKHEPSDWKYVADYQVIVRSAAGKRRRK